MLTSKFSRLKKILTSKFFNLKKFLTIKKIYKSNLKPDPEHQPKSNLSTQRETST